jgi:hypothetical protein
VKRQTGGHTKPRPEEIAQFEPLSIHQLGRLLAAGKIAMKRKLAGQKSKPRSPK